MMFEVDPEESRERLASGESWSDFCDMLKAAGQIILDGPEDEQSRAEGFRYLSRLTRAALEAFVEHNDPKAPVLMRVVHETVKMGADNPDNYYQNAAISGKYSYVLKGTRGTAHWLEFATQVGSYGQGRGMPPSGHLASSELEINPDGTFEILLSCEKPESGNWLPMLPETGTLIVRQARMIPDQEELADLTIHRVGGDGEPTPLDAVRMDTGLTTAGLLVGGAPRIFVGWADMFQSHINQLPRFDQALSDSMGGVPGIAYYHSYWKLAPDECLVIEAVPPECDHWNFQLNNHWMESLDYRYYQIHLNSGTAVTEPDGSIKVIVAHEDPGHPNWIRTVGHNFGTMCFRWVQPEGEPPVPNTRVVKLADLRRELA